MADVSAALRARHARIAQEQFGEVDAVMDLFLVRCEEDAHAGRNEAHHGEFAHVEVAGILGLTETAARRMVGLGCELRWRLHRVSAAFEAGRIDLAKAHALADVLANVSDEHLEEIEQRLLEGADRESTTRLKARARRLIARLDADHARQRRERAEHERDVWVTVRDDAVSEIGGLLPAVGGRIVADRLRAMSFDVCTHDPRSYGQRRADALVALASGHTHLDCGCGRGECNARTEATGNAESDVRIQVLVGVNAATLLGLDDAPGFLFGHGPIDADLAREIAADGTWKQVLTLSDTDRARLSAAATTDSATPSAAAAAASGFGPVAGIGRTLPAPGLSPAEATARHRERTYRPTARLAETVRVRDGACRFPNCSVPTTACDLDHTVPFDHDHPAAGGPTTEQNLACLCRKHHRLKTIGYWQVKQVGDGVLEWTDPTGHVTHTTPQGPFADADLHARVPDGLRGLLTDARTLTKLGPSIVEQELSYFLDAHVPPQQRRRRGHTPRRCERPSSPDPAVSTQSASTQSASTQSTTEAADGDPPPF